MDHGTGYLAGEVVVQECPALELKLSFKSEASAPVHTKKGHPNREEFSSVPPESALVQLQPDSGSSCSEMKDKPKVLLSICCSWSFASCDPSQDLILHVKPWPWFIGLTYAR